jgi:hypothetical protein
LIGTCAALVLAAVGDEATGYDGPGPLIYLALAGLVLLVRWRFAPLLAAAMACFFLIGGLFDSSFMSRLADPRHGLDFAAGWLQMLAFAATIAFAVAAVWVGRGQSGRAPARRRVH